MVTTLPVVDQKSVILTSNSSKAKGKARFSLMNLYFLIGSKGIWEQYKFG